MVSLNGNYYFYKVSNMIEPNISSKEQLFFNSLRLLVFTIPLSLELTSLMIIVTLITGIYSGVSIVSIKSFFESKLRLLLIGYFLLAIVSIFYTENKQAAWSDIEAKLSFFLFPFFIGKGFFLKETYLNRIKESFVYGCLTAFFICLAHSSVQYYITGNLDQFFYGNFSVLRHSSYFALYLCLSIAFLLFSNFTISKSNFFIFLTLLVISVLLCSSRSGYLSLIILGFIYLARLIFIEKKTRIALLTASLLILLAGLSYQIPVIKMRIKSDLRLEHSNDSQNKVQRVSRLDVWKNSIKLIAMNPWFGVGSGDVRSELSKLYKESNLVKAEERKSNAHNQFLQTQLNYGLMGTFVLIFIFYLLFRDAIISLNWSNFSFALLLLCSFLFESMLETQAGIVFFVLFTLLLFGSESKQSSVI